MHMVTWAKLQALKQTMAGGEPPCLVMNGVRYDNATRDLLEQKGDGYDNNDRIFTVATRSEDDFRDFVWFRRRVRIAGPFHTGGHPFLAGFRGIYCAGRVARGMFDFHSGHYHPKLRNVVYYMYEFIENSCQNLQGMQRDQKVDELCKIPLELYYDDSETEKYATTFKRILNGGKLERDYGARNTMTMGESRLHPKYGQSSGSAISFNSTQSIVKLGVTPHVQHLGTFRRQGRANWVDDDECTKCFSCRKEFSFFLRKHHCRQCGFVFCDECSDNRKKLTMPAIRPEGVAKTGLVRVCDVCARIPEPTLWL
jgi:FYVE zinc finger